jgi:hypothetical protein
MKKGKSCEIKGYKNIKCVYGTVDSKNFKSLYINIQSWVQPKEYYEDWRRHVSFFSKTIRQTLMEILDLIMFDSKSIVDVDLRTSGIAINKRSFMNLEITLFLKNKIDFKSVKIKNAVKHLISTIKKEVFEKSKIFEFYLRKNDKVSNLTAV